MDNNPIVNIPSAIPALRRSALILGALVCLVTAVALLAQAGLPQRAQFTSRIEVGGIEAAPELGHIAPSFVATLSTGTTIRLHDLQGRVVVLNFWATWCVPCRAEMPELQALANDYPIEQMQIIGINMGEPATAIEAWRDELNLTFDLVVDPSNSIAALYHIRGQPTTYIIDTNGIIANIIYGATTRQALESTIATLVSD
jgi:cytochrome c biogenesis protein CcmG, thiol:disulfide interchange protein DsbE